MDKEKIYLSSVAPRLPMKDIELTKQFYTEKLNFKVKAEYGSDYLILQREKVELHFFSFPELNEKENYGMCYIRVKNIEQLYQDVLEAEASLAELGYLETKPWGQKEFSVVGPNGNLITFGESAG